MPFAEYYFPKKKELSGYINIEQLECHLRNIIFQKIKRQNRTALL